MSDPTFGININRVDNEPRPAVASDMSVVGFVGTAPAADADDFPLDTPILMYSDDAAKIAALGASGTLPDAIAGINDQLGEFQVAAKVVVVRCAAGVDTDATIANLVGSLGAKTGIYALLEAGSMLGTIPRLIAVPGYTSQHEIEDGETAVVSAAKPGGNTGGGTLTLANPKHGSEVIQGVYLVRCIGGTHTGTGAAKAGGNIGNGTIGSITAAGASAKAGVYKARCFVEANNGGQFVVEDPDGNVIGIATVGQAFSNAAHIGFTITDGSEDFDVGDGFDITVVAAVPANGGKFSVYDPNGDRLADATVGDAYTGDHIRFTIADSGTDFAIGDGFNVTVTITGGNALANPVCAALPAVLEKLLAHAVVDGPASTQAAFTTWRETISSDRIIPLETAVKVGIGAVVKPGSPRVLGIAVRRDHEFEGRPFHSWANQPLQGIVGPNRPINFSLTDGATEGQAILSQNGGIIVRGEMGVESAIASGGFVYVGTDNAGEDDLWRFYNVTRGRDYIHLLFLRTLRFYLGKFNLTGQAIEAVTNTMKFALRDLKADGDILGYRVFFTRDQNSPENLRQGRFTVDFQAEEAPVFRYLGLRSARYRPALDILLDELLAQIDVAA